MVLGVFVTQIVTDLLDKIVIVYLVLAAIKVMPRNYKLSFNQRMNGQNG